MHDITLEQCLEMRRQHATLVDVRSPGEYEQFHIPGAINIPIFTNEERSEIGTIYKQESVDKAKERGLEIASAKLPALYKQYRDIHGPIVIYCWRGGMRSRTMATVMSLMGLKVHRLQGGIRTYRQWVQDQLEHYQLQVPCVVIAGHTGTGKTELLLRLAAEGYPVLDLEGIAAHRGSIFGHIGQEPRNQRMFDSLLWERLMELEQQQAPYIMLEAESRRIGKVTLPEFIMEGKQRGKVIQIELPLEERVRHLMADYDPEMHKEEMIEAFERIKMRIHTPIATEISLCLKDGRYHDAAALMLEHYYDPRYQFAGNSYEQGMITIEAANVDEAEGLLKQQI